MKSAIDSYHGENSDCNVSSSWLSKINTKRGFIVRCLCYRLDLFLLNIVNTYSITVPEPVSLFVASPAWQEAWRRRVLLRFPVVAVLSFESMLPLVQSAAQYHHLGCHLLVQASFSKCKWWGKPTVQSFNEYQLGRNQSKGLLES